MNVRPTLFHKPITLDSLAELFAHHRAGFGGWRMEGEGGGSGDGGEGGEGGGSGGGSGDGGSGGGGEEVPEGYATDSQGKSLGYPASTKVEDMKVEEQAAYYKHQSRKHEQRATEYRTAAGGKSAAEVKAERDELIELRRKGMTPDQRAIDEAKEAGREEARKEAAPRMARLALDTALAHLPDDERSSIIEDLDLSKVVTESGDVDTDKVKAIAKRHGAPGKGTSTPDYGGGRRSSTTGSGVAAGAEMHAAQRKKPAPTP